jgi:3-oxoacyl-[acyl-carrier protein] reductase
MSWGKSPGSPDVDEEINWQRKPVVNGKRLEGQNALVTGSSKGFGRTIALALADEGANVVVNYNSSEKAAKSVVEEIKKKGVKSFAVKADIRKLDQVKNMADRVWEEFGSCDVLINNAGETAATMKSWRELDEEVINDTFELDVKGTLYCLTVFGERMLDKQKSGTIVNVASNVIVTGSPRSPIYAAAKYGVIGLTKSYALSLAPFVRVNAVAPGYMDTPSLRARQDWTDERRKFLVNQTPLRSIGNPDNIAHIVTFLASQDSFHMTGNTVLCDGGFGMIGA